MNDRLFPDAQIADSIGLPTEEGIFGFKPFPEVRRPARHRESPGALLASHLCTSVRQTIRCLQACIPSFAFSFHLSSMQQSQHSAARGSLPPPNSPRAGLIGLRC